MGNNKQGGSRIVKTMTKKHGSYEAYQEWMRSIASKGGKQPTLTPKGFAANRELASRVGRIGGKVSKRTKNEV